MESKYDETKVRETRPTGQGFTSPTGAGFTSVSDEGSAGAGFTSVSARKNKKKIPWKSVLGVAVVLVILWQIFHVVTQGSGKPAAANGHRSPASSTVPSTRPTPVPTVTLGGRPVAAGGGPVIVLNPGLVAPGGHVSIYGSGFNPHAAITVWLMRSSQSGKGSVVAHGKASGNGSLITSFTMPTSLNVSRATVVAEQAGSSKRAVAQLVSPGGVGTATIDGKSAGKPGDTVTVSAHGFGPGEKVNVYWGRASGTPALTLTADSAGSISHASVPVGVAPTGETTLVLVGTKTHTTATAPYLMLGLYPTAVFHPYAARAGGTIIYTGGGFAPGEQVLIYLNSSTGMPALTTTASSSGRFSVSFVVPFGLKGKESLTATGEQSRASVSSGFTVLPYLPSAQASTYDALPGTSVSFYATGFAANEVVLVYTGGRGTNGQLVTAFRVNGKGSAANAGHYIVPSGVGPGLYFKLVGQHSGGSATAKISVTTPAQQVTVPPQRPYVLPPSLGGKQPVHHSKAASKSPGASHATQSGRNASSRP
jgi:hypothetical protein